MKHLCLVLALSSSSAFAGIVCGSPSKVVFPGLLDKYELIKEHSEGLLTIESKRNSISYQGNLLVNNHYRLVNTNMHSSGGNANLEFDDVTAREISDESQSDQKRYITVEKRKASDCRLERGFNCLLRPERVITIINTDEGDNKVILSNYRMSHEVFQQYKIKGEAALSKSYSYFTATFEDCVFRD